MSANDSSDWNRLRRGKFVTVGKKVYGICRRCHAVVRVNKPLIGSLHLCDVEEEGKSTSD